MAAPAACPPSLLRRRDEVGELASALSDSAAALWARMDATERFAADVAHEIKNPLSSIRSAIETLPRIEDPGRQRQLLTIIGAGRGAAGPADQRLSATRRAWMPRCRASPRGRSMWCRSCARCRNSMTRRAIGQRSEAGGGGAAGGHGGLGGRGPAGAGAAQPDRQRAVVQPAATDGSSCGSATPARWRN